MIWTKAATIDAERCAPVGVPAFRRGLVGNFCCEYVGGGGEDGVFSD
jgi:hypothetical protein